MKLLLNLYMAFFRIGAFTFGGGYAMLPMLKREVVEKHGWASEEDLINYFALGRCTPGVIAVNTATFVGYDQKGVIGGIAATLGVVTPSLIIILAIASLLQNVMHIDWVMSAFAGIRAGVAALVVTTVIGLIKTNVYVKKAEGDTRSFLKRNYLNLILCIIAFAVVAVLGESPVYVVIGAGLLGLASGKWGGKVS